jgi:polypeptide N-acetylgalactosaminyltransferase
MSVLNVEGNHMASIIFYNSDTANINQSISDLLNKTPKILIDEIIVCNDTGSPDEIPDTKQILSDHIGRARAWNLAAEEAKSGELIFLGGPTKFGQDWLPPLLDMIRDEKCLVSPIVHTLDLNLWAMEDDRYKRFGWRWDLELYSRRPFQINESPAISSYCFAVTKDWFDAVGRFDDGMQNGLGEDVEISLRNWLFGGRCLVAEESFVAAAFRGLDAGPKTTRNLSRIVEAWMPEYSTYFYQSRGIDRVDCGRIDNLLNLRDKQRRSIDWFLNCLQPELFGVYKLKGTATGKSVAVVGPSASLDLINPAWVNRHDIIIGVDYTGMVYECDYVVTDAAQVVVELRKNYGDERLVLPVAMENQVAGRFDPASSIAPGAVQFELGRVGSVQETNSVDPPFCNFENSVLSAVHFALYLNPKYITLFGCDNKIIFGMSHSANIEYYNGGDLWPDSDTIRKRFALYEFGLGRLSQLAQKSGIPLFRLNHA